MAYSITTPIIGPQPIAEFSDVARHPLGTVVEAFDPNLGAGQFVYAKGVANTAVGSWVTITAKDGSTALLAANAIGRVGIAMAATVANNYGWYQITGKGVGKALAGYLDNARVYATSTAGSIDDTVVAGDRIKNVMGASAVGTPSTGLAYFDMYAPFADDIADPA